MTQFKPKTGPTHEDLKAKVNALCATLTRHIEANRLGDAAKIARTLSDVCLRSRNTQHAHRGAGR